MQHRQTYMKQGEDGAIYGRVVLCSTELQDITLSILVWEKLLFESMLPSDASLNLYCSLSAAKPLDMALHYYKILSAGSSQPTAASTGQHGQAPVSWYSHFQWPFPSLHLIHHSQSHRTEHPFLKLYFETLNQTFSCLTSSLSLPTLFAQFLSLNLLFDCIRTMVSHPGYYPQPHTCIIPLPPSCILRLFCSLHTIWKISSWINTICEFSCWEASGENHAVLWTFIVINLNKLSATLGNLTEFL